MNAEEEEIARKVWTESVIGTRTGNLKELAKRMIPLNEFSRLQTEFQKQYLNPSEIISEILTLWKSYKSTEATLSMLEKHFRDLDLNADAGTQFNIISRKLNLLLYYNENLYILLRFLFTDKLKKYIDEINQTYDRPEIKRAKIFHPSVSEPSHCISNNLTSDEGLKTPINCFLRSPAFNSTVASENRGDLKQFLVKILSPLSYTGKCFEYLNDKFPHNW